MLSELIFASVPTQSDRQSGRASGLSCSGLFPCPWRLYCGNIGNSGFSNNPTPQQILNMEDGWEQEEKTVKRLKRAGVVIYNRQDEVCIGKSKILGHFDGMVNLGEEMIWEHKAWASERYDLFNLKGFEAYPGEKAQVMAYIHGKGLQKADFMVLKKESNDYTDIVVDLDMDFLQPILDWADAIRLERWVPKPEICKYCAYCGLNCFDKVIDFRGIGSESADEMAKKWIQGKALSNVGEMYMEEARNFFVGTPERPNQPAKPGLIGNRDILLVSGLEVKKIIQHRNTPDKSKILQEFGAEALLRISTELEVTQYRIRELS